MEMDDKSLSTIHARRSSLCNLPSEVLLMVCEFLADNPNCLASLARSCVKLNGVASRVLYDNIMVDNKSLARMLASYKVEQGGKISKSLDNLARDWNLAKLPTRVRAGVACKNLKLLDFPYYTDFFEHATDPEYAEKIKRHVEMHGKALPKSHLSYERGNALKVKAGIVATMSGIRTLAVDIPEKEDFFKHLFMNLYHQSKMRTWKEASGELLIAPEPTTVEQAMASHFSSLRVIELRCAKSVYHCETMAANGTIVIHGSWPNVPSLETFKYHGSRISPDVQATFLSECLPNVVALNDFACNGQHNPFITTFQSSRDNFQNFISDLSWKNMAPCNAVMQQVAALIAGQAGSLESVSLVRQKRTSDGPRGVENFECGALSFHRFSALEYLDVDSRFLIRTEGPETESLLDWLGLPPNLQILSIDAITHLEIPYFRTYLGNLLEAVQSGLLPSLKRVRCGFIGMIGGVKVEGWKILANTPGVFMGHGVLITGWQYDDMEDVEGSIIVNRVRARVGTRRRRAPDA